tara:strand:+ start:1076 stop:1276 length:201 start_codon:yes stop_codon:yes gene_type:complete
VNWINIYRVMKKRSEKILKIRKKLQDYNKFIIEYGFNSENDIFINEDISKIINELDELEKELENEK